MKAAIVCISDNFFDRVRMLKKYYLSKGCEVVVVTSDFSHRKKEKMDSLEDADILLDTPRYSRNLSLKRMRSHRDFAKSAAREMERLKPDIIHTIVPANSLCKAMAGYKKKHPEVRLYFDINDLWPEALPIRGFEWFPVFTSWRKLREDYLPYADEVFLECELFKEGIRTDLDYTVLHFARSNEPMPIKRKLSKDRVELVYLGSINNIIDIDLICKIADEVGRLKPTTVHIIGEGENKDRLIESLKKTRADVRDHGVIFDVDEKQAVFDCCNYGLNVMKPDVMVGLTMKSLDYMIGGVPLINSIGGDTSELVEKYDLGYNVDRDNLKQLARSICEEDLETQYKRRENMQKVYKDFFSEAVFFDTLSKAKA